MCLYQYSLCYIFIEYFFPVEGKELPGAPGYKYYGAAKDLPGVRELFQEKDDESELRRRKRWEEKRGEEKRKEEKRRNDESELRRRKRWEEKRRRKDREKKGKEE